MRIHIIVGLYPIPFKPYYDAQFSQLTKDGHDLTIFAYGQHGKFVNAKVVEARLEERIRRYPVTLKHLPTTIWRAVGNAIRSPIRAAEGVGAVLRSTKGLKQKLVGAIRAWILLEGEPDLVLVHETGTAILFPWIKEVARGAPVAFYYHGGEVPTTTPLPPGMVSSAFRSVDAVFTNTEFSKEQAISRGCPVERVHVLPVGFDIDDYRPEPDRRYRPGGKLRLLSAGRMSEEKGLIYALEAIRELVYERDITDVHYSLAGTGHTRSGLEAFVAEHQLDPFVSFLGVLDTRSLIDEQARSDVLLLPSIAVGNSVETQACAVQEIMLLHGLAITTDIGGVPESIAPELEQLVVPQRDSSALADAIERVWRLSDTELARLGRRAREFVVARYDIKDLNERLLKTTIEEAAVRSGSQR